MIYVSELRESFQCKKWHWKNYAYLLGDNVNELIQFGESIGLRKKWLQKGTLLHFDLTVGKRKLAILKGAQPIFIRDFMKKK